MVRYFFRKFRKHFSPFLHDVKTQCNDIAA
jgi:hypothetical protein